MARPNKTDPIRNFKFRVQILPQGAALKNQVGDQQIGTLGFAVVSGLSVSNELIQYREGGMNTHPHKMIGQSDYAPVTFSKGLFAHEASLYKWQTFMHNWTQGGVGGGSSSNDNDYRADILVSVYDHPVSSGSYTTPGEAVNNNASPGRRKLAFKLYNCWPASYSLTDLSAGESSIMIQQMVINHEGFAVSFASDANGEAPLTGL